MKLKEEKNSSTSLTPIKAVGAVIVKDKKILLTKRAAYKKSYPNCWDAPGGDIKDGETPKEAIVREVKEELKEWRYCPKCRITTKLKECPKDGTKTKKITLKNKYYTIKSILKILLDKKLITKVELVKFELIKISWKYKDDA